MSSAELPRRSTTGQTVHYGYGFTIRANGDRIGHGGGGPGVNGELRIYRNAGWVISTLTNIDPPHASHMAVELENRLLGEDGAESCL